MKKLIFSAFTFLLAGVSFAQQLNCRQIVDESVKKGSPQDAVNYISKELVKLSSPAEKRALLAYLGSLQELLCQYDEAEKSYVQAAGIAAGSVDGMPKKSSERLVLDAVRTALCAGDADSALSYLNSAVRNSKSEEIQAQIKLYEQWAKLSLADDLSKAEEPVALLKTYVNLSSMKSVKPSVLLTLWYTTGDKKYSEALVNEFSNSPEAGIVTGKVQILPTPFWFFLPKHNDANVLNESEIKPVSEAKSVSPVEKVSEAKSVSPAETLSEAKTTASSENALQSENNRQAQDQTSSSMEKNSTASKTASSTETVSHSSKSVRLQLGLFRDKNNSNAFVGRLKEKGFDAYIQEETRESGTTYYLVMVDENSEGNMALKLKSAGFESYPVF